LIVHVRAGRFFCHQSERLRGCVRARHGGHSDREASDPSVSGGPEAGFRPGSSQWYPLERARLQEWLNFITSEIHAASSPLFNRDLPKTVREFFETKLTRRFDLVETGLVTKDYLMGNRFTVADAYLFTVLGWMKGFGMTSAAGRNSQPTRSVSGFALRSPRR